MLAWGASAAQSAEIDSLQSLAREDTWTEIWLDADGQQQSRQVRARLWTAAIQGLLDQQNTVHLPAREEPYYLDSPIILKSGQSLSADPATEIRLKPGTNTCMVRNQNLGGFANGPARESLQPDEDITIEGGIWTALANGVKGANGNLRGASSTRQPIPGTHGVILLHNVRRITVRHVTIRQSKAFAVHLAHAREFVVDGVRLDRHERDGVHVNGPASHGAIRNVSGDSHDDTVALNAWEWKNYAPSFGAIHHITIENITGSPNSKRSADSIRLLPGVKRFSDGTTLDCPIHDITVRNITDIREFKFYEQPNLELGRANDFSIEPGTLRHINLQRLTFNRPGVIQIAAEASDLRIDDVNLRFTPAPAFKLIEIGPMSATYRHSPDPATWVEIFSPDRDVTVRGFHLDNVRLNNQSVPDSSTFVQVRDQQFNSDYPKTTPRGGIGKAKLLP